MTLVITSHKAVQFMETSQFDLTFRSVCRWRIEGFFIEFDGSLRDQSQFVSELTRNLGNLSQN